MSVYQLKDGRWIVQYRDPARAGKYKREYFGRGAKGERAARKRDADLGARPYKRRTPSRRGPIFEALANEYLSAKQGRIEPSTLDVLFYKLAGVLLPAFGHLNVYRINDGVLNRFVKRRLKGGVKRTTVHRDLADLQAILNWAQKEKYITKNPVAGYAKPKRDDAHVRPPTGKEATRILKHSPGHLRRALLLCYYTGLRPGPTELLRITWDDIDLKRQTITAISAKKRGRPYRIIPIHPALAPLLKTWKKEDKGRGPVIHFRGRAIKSIKRSYARAKTKAKITAKLPPYAWRHAFATYGLAAGGDLKAISEMLGHSRTDTTTRIYQHTDLALYRGAVAKMPALDLPA